MWHLAIVTEMHSTYSENLKNLKNVVQGWLS